MNMTNKDKRTAQKGVKMEHRHFSMIAASLCAMREVVNIDATTWESVCWYMASELRNTNPKFDKRRFLSACGVEQ